MISEKRSQAARVNGARSRGPITLEGKSISARNAMRHGLLANTIVLTNEEGISFEALFNFHVARFSPVDDVEMSMIEEMCASYWRLRRTWAMETSILESGIANQPPGTPIEQTVGAFCDAVSDSHLALLHRYETRLHGMYQRAIRNLMLLRKIPKSAGAPPPEPAPPELQPEPNAPLPNEPRAPIVCTPECAWPAQPRQANAPIQPPKPLFGPDRPPCSFPDLPFAPFGPLRFP